MFIPPRNPTIFHILFSLRGSIAAKIWRRVAYTMLLSVLVNFTHGQVYDHKITLTPTAFTIMGLTLAIFLGFRNTASYDRFWEARKLWGEMLITCRNLARQFITLPRAPRAEATRQRVYLAIAFAYALKNHAGSSVQVLGPTPAFYERVRDTYRWQLVVKSPRRQELIDLLAYIPQTHWQTELDPTSLL